MDTGGPNSGSVFCINLAGPLDSGCVRGRKQESRDTNVQPPHPSARSQLAIRDLSAWLCLFRVCYVLSHRINLR